MKSTGFKLNRNIIRNMVMAVLFGSVFIPMANAQEMLLLDTKDFDLPDSSHFIGPTNEYAHGWILPHFNWVSPVNYLDGRLYQYVEIIQRPTTRSFFLTPIIDETINKAPCQKDVKEYSTLKNGHHWGMKEEITETGVYLQNKLVKELRDATNLFTTSKMSNPPCLRFWLANQSAPGVNFPFSNKDIYPMKLRIIWVVCAAGHEFSGWENYVDRKEP